MKTVQWEFISHFKKDLKNRRLFQGANTFFYFFPKQDKSFQDTLKKLCNLHSKNWSVVSTLITAQKQCLGKCCLNTQKCLFKWENVTYKCENDTFKCENDTPFILTSVGNDTCKCRN
jgi:hypothetical protein